MSARGSNSTLRVAIDARALGGAGGAGIETVVQGLIDGLAQLDGPEEYVLLVDSSLEIDLDHWLESSHRSVAAVPVSFAAGARLVARRRRLLRSALIENGVALGQRYLEALTDHRPGKMDELLKSIGCSVVHFPTPQAFPTTLPSIYQPHDLQHLHFPEFFRHQTVKLRNARYGRWSAQANRVVVGSEWIRNDILERMQLPKERVAVIPLAPEKTRSASNLKVETHRHDLARFQPYMLYPAQFWPHKNHVRLLEAFAEARRDPLLSDLKLVLTGSPGPSSQAVTDAMADFDVEKDVHVLGYVSESELAALYQACLFVVIPTLFEAGSFPMWEAFQHEKAVAIADVTSLARMSGGHAQLFDPLNIQSIAQSIRLLSTNEALRETSGLAGKIHTDQYTWVETARRFRSQYRIVTGQNVDEWDTSIVKGDPLQF